MKKILVDEGDEIIIFDDEQEERKTRIQIFNINKNRAGFSIKANEDLRISRNNVCDGLGSYKKRGSNKKSRRAKVLIVEDDPIAQMIIRDNLTALNCIIKIADTGNAAIKLFDDSYDLIVLDIGLPDMSGLEVCKMIRKKQTRHIPIIIATAHGENMRQESLKAGADVFMIKPYKMKIIEEYL